MKFLFNRKLWTAIGCVGGAIILVGLIAGRVLYRRWRIPQDGMYPGLPAQSRFWARKYAYSSVADVRRGDVVVFRQQRADITYDFVWRVVALPGQRLAIRKDTVIVDGQALGRSPLRTAGEKQIFRESADGRSWEIAVPIAAMPKWSEFPETTVPPGHVFVLGDNRHDALDSRSMGPIAFETIIGRAGW